MDGLFKVSSVTPFLLRVGVVGFKKVRPSRGAEPCRAVGVCVGACVYLLGWEGGSRLCVPLPACQPNETQHKPNESPRTLPVWCAPVWCALLRWVLGLLGCWVCWALGLRTKCAGCAGIAGRWVCWGLLGKCGESFSEDTKMSLFLAEYVRLSE